MDLVDLGSDVISHQSTELMWQKDDNNGLIDWEAALTYCAGLVKGVYSDWRLPNIKELHTIVDYTMNSPAINPAVFSFPKSQAHWSSTTDDSNSSNAYFKSI